MSLYSKFQWDRLCISGDKFRVEWGAFKYYISAFVGGKEGPDSFGDIVYSLMD